MQLFQEHDKGVKSITRHEELLYGKHDWMLLRDKLMKPKSASNVSLQQKPQMTQR